MSDKIQHDILCQVEDKVTEVKQLMMSASEDDANLQKWMRILKTEQPPHGGWSENPSPAPTERTYWSQRKSTAEIFLEGSSSASSRSWFSCEKVF